MSAGRGGEVVDRAAERADRLNPGFRVSELGPQDALVMTSGDAEERGEARKPIDWEICKRLFFEYMWRYPRLQVLIIFHAALLAMIYTSIPLILKYTIEYSIEEPATWEGLVGRLGLPIEATALNGVIAGAALLGVAALSFYTVMFFRLVSINRLAECVVHDLRMDIYRHVQRLHMQFFDMTKVGWILSRGTSDVNALRNAVAQVIPRFLIHALETVLFIAVMIWMDWVLALTILALGPVFWIVNSWFRRRMGDAYRRVQLSMSRITANLAETIAGIRVTQSYAREEKNSELFRNLCLHHRGNNMRAAHYHGLYIPILDLSNQAVVAIIIGLGGYRVFSGTMDVSELLGFLFFTGKFFTALQVLAEIYNVTLMAMAGGERIFKLLDTKPEVVDAPGARALPAGGGVGGARVAFEGVTFGYDAEKPVLRDVSFVAEPGETVALVGHTGSGKTTIVGLIGRLYAHQRGRIVIDETPIEEATIASLHAQMSLVLQENFLFTGTVMENILFGNPEAGEDDAVRACRALDCLDVFERLPKGLHTDAGERGDSLSLGQRQLACFARAWLADPRILMLDEATSAVDTATEYRLQVALERLMEGRTSIVVAHRLSTIRGADKILVLDHGELIEQGSHGELVEMGGHYAKLHGEFVRLSGQSADVGRSRAIE